MRSMRSTISIGVCTYGTVPSSQPQVWVCPHAGVASSAKTSQRFRKIKEKSSSGKMAFHAPVAQWIEQPPPKGQVARSIRVRGATDRRSPAARNVTRHRFLLFAALLLAVAPASVAQTPTAKCDRGDKACARKLLAASPLRQSSHWAAMLRRPLEERIAIGPPEVVEYLVLDVIANAFPNKPRASTPDAAFMADM